MIIQLYPNQNELKIDDHGDEHVYWLCVNDEQAAFFSSLSWLILTQIDLEGKTYFNVDYDIYDEGLGAAFRVANDILTTYQGETIV
ncbi:MAG: hypothetical protein ACK4PR_01270 [Gammaproteobacteria bacterium]